MSQCNIDNLSLGQIKELQAIFGGVQAAPLPFKIGEKYFIRTVTQYLTGQVVAIHGKFVEMSDAAWIAHTGEYSEALHEGAKVFRNIEPYPENVTFNSDAIIDFCRWTHKLPTEQKD